MTRRRGFRDCNGLRSGWTRREGEGRDGCRRGYWYWRRRSDGWDADREIDDVEGLDAGRSDGAGDDHWFLSEAGEEEAKRRGRNENQYSSSPNGQDRKKNERFVELDDGEVGENSVEAAKKERGSAK